MLWANGIGLSPDSDVLYVSDYAAGEVLAFDPDGRGRRVFAQLLVTTVGSLMRASAGVAGRPVRPARTG